MATSQPPAHDPSTERVSPADIRHMDRATDAIWRRLAEGIVAPWLDDIRTLRAPGDDIDASLDMWSIALIAELKDPGRKAYASTVLARLRQLSDEIEGRIDDDG